MANPLVPQGTLNRIKGAVNWTANPTLNVTSPFLGDAGISLAFEGEATDYLPQMTGAVRSPAPFQMITLSINLIRTQDLANLFKRQLETDSALGDAIVWPDVQVGGIENYQIYNCAIKNVRELPFNGKDAAYMIMVGGYYLTNSSLFDAA